jgi:GNAT superfamily N-acetyltransferase
MSEITYREAEISDIEEIVDLWEKLMQIHAGINEYWKTIPNSKSNYLNHIKEKIISNDTKVVLAMSDKKIIGFSWAEVRKDIPIYDRKVCNINDLFVSENFRGQGIAKKLFKKLEDFAKEKHAEYIMEQNSIENKATVKFYDSIKMDPLMQVRIKKVQK